MVVQLFNASNSSRAEGFEALSAACQVAGWIQLQPPQVSVPMVSEAALPGGSGFVIASGGSTGGQGFCVQPRANLDASAEATARWLLGIGIDPQNSVLLNPLPLHHISGLMPWWRSRVWGAQHLPLEPDWIKEPALMSARIDALADPVSIPRLLSVVPTQLIRLMEDPAGLECLKSCAVIWVGGAGLNSCSRAAARREQLNLAPCYGATETTAMVTALPPQHFLEGLEGCGDVLGDVEIHLDVDGSLMVRTNRLATGRWNGAQDSAPEGLRDGQGWWRSGDLARWLPGKGGKGMVRSLQLIGRRDAVINSGGETLFLETLEEQMGELFASMPIQSLLLLGLEDSKWGQKLVGLVRFSHEISDIECVNFFSKMSKKCLELPPPGRPRLWLHCPSLEMNGAGKWERECWAAWAVNELTNSKSSSLND